MVVKTLAGFFMKKSFICIVLILVLMISHRSISGFAKESFLDYLSETVAEAPKELNCKSAILMEATNGRILYEQNSDEPLSPASITKIMTLLLIFEALEEGKIQLEDSVVTSAYAKSMGGSQVFLEEGEVQSVETLIKCIVVSSGNDASVAMAEHIAGSESAFVEKMNQRAKELGMEESHFEDCCGLSDSNQHYMSAKDVAIAARELVTRFPEIEKYSTIWMDTIIHETKQGTKEFGLSNTNKLLKMGTSFRVTGLKTGSTSKAKYCFCATAEKEGVKLIAVIMAAPDYKTRFSLAKSALDYGFARCQIYKDDLSDEDFSVTIRKGVRNSLQGEAETFFYVATQGENLNEIKKSISFKRLTAPIKKGDSIGKVRYTLQGEEIGERIIYAKESVKAADFLWYLIQSSRCIFGGKDD